MRPEIEEFCRSRKIPALLHFTRANNLPSILKNGSVPRSHIDGGNCDAQTNDPHRLDGRRNFNCLSIGFPNSDMFYKFRMQSPGVDWPIILFHRDIMWSMNALFCWRNAASQDISSRDQDSLRSLVALQELYEERKGFPTRGEQFLIDYDPTNVQAEVMVEGVIPPEKIRGIIFPNKSSQQLYKDIVGDLKTYVSNRAGFYSDRKFYRKYMSNN